ncbi:phage holin [Collinsella intestinalis]|uniref:phage holin n=1 Tax=Collinsella intestinalis TaxID=147207 RepID=UPI0022E34B6B|nr:phage holin [Collinsella intestinalis]
MQINWKIRLKNPVFIAQLACAAVMPLVVGTGAAWEDMTSWATLWQTLATALGNPVVVVTMLTSLWAAITDPTTSGTSDSKSALERTELKGNYKKEA